MKKSLKTLAASALMLLASQNVCADSVYVGGSLGLAIPQVRFGSNYLETGEHHHTVGGATTFLGGALVGVDYTFCDLFCTDLYTAIELNVRYNSFNKKIFGHTDTAGISNFSVRVKNNLQYGADFKFGIPVDCCGTTPYLLVGVQAAEWKTKIKNDSNVAFRNIPANSSVSFTKTKAGANIGGGVRFKLNDCVDMDLQYSYTWYHKHSRSYSVDNEGIATWKHSARLEQNKVLLSVTFPLWDLGNCCCF